METKHLIALPLLFAAAIIGMTLAGFSRRCRELAFFLLASSALLGEHLDVNFHAHYWYRGTTRGFEVSLIDILALSVLVGAWFSPAPDVGRRRYWPIGLAPLLLYFCYAAFSVAVTEPRVYGLFELTKIARGILVFIAVALFVRTPRDVAIMVAGVGLAVWIEGIYALKQHFIGGVYRAPGTLDHANSLSMYLCLTAPLFIAAATADFPRPLRLFSMSCFVIAAVSELFTVSRAGIPIFVLVSLGVAACCLSWRPTFGKIAAIGGIVVLCGGFMAGSWESLRQRYGEATLAQEYFDTNIEGRGYYLRVANAILQERPFGVGLNNWSYSVSKTYGGRFGYPYEDYDNLYYIPSREVLPSIRYAAPAHSLAALTAGELGLIGLFLFGVLWVRWLAAGVTFLWPRRDDPMRRMAVGCFFGICGMLMQSITEWTYRQTPIFFTSHVLLGTLAALYYFRREERREALEAETAPAEE